MTAKDNPASKLSLLERLFQEPSWPDGADRESLAYSNLFLFL